MAGKQKTHKGASKRFKITATGKIRHKKACSGHLMSTKPGRRKRRLRKSTILAPGDQKKYEKVLAR